ncbi:MAG TPA: hypothetical protein VF719_09735, partial [Abditibacteriaceae bacterium]
TGPTTSALTYNLSSSVPARATVPSAAQTFNIGESQKTFAINTVNNNLTDGNRAVTITAAPGAGYTRVPARITVVDDDVAPATSTLAWGYNDFGQIGNNSRSHQPAPIAIAAWGDAVQLSAGGGHTLALQRNGTVLSGGYNAAGQLGNNRTTDSLVPVAVPNLSNVAQVAAGWYHSLALKTDGTVWAWGNNSYGQVGNGSTQNVLVPVQISSLSNQVSAIAAGVYHSVALKKDGTVWAWGSNFYGQLGDGTNTDRLVPVRSGTGIDLRAQSIAAGAGHTLARQADRVRAWGWNADGQLGIGNTTNQAVPVTVPNLSGVTFVSAGYSHSLALTGGRIRAWGHNAYGQLGNNSTATSSVPVTVSGLTGVTQISAGAAHNLAVRSDETIWSWGNNAYGSLGNNSTANQRVPVQINRVASVQTVAAGYGHNLAVGVLAPVSTVRTASPLSSASANVSSSSVQLRWSTVMNAPSAGAASNFSVVVDGRAVAINSASYASASNSTTLSLAAGTIRVGSKVQVSWRDLRDTNGALVADGTTTVTAG